MIRALFLDAAGTLIDLAEPVGAVYARLLGRHGIHHTAEDLERRFRASFGAMDEPDFQATDDGDQAERRWWRSLVEAALDQAVGDAAFQELFDHYARPEAWKIYPDTLEFLHRASDAGFKLAVVSNFDRRLHPILRGLHLSPFFEAVISSADARARKPSPLIFRHALEAIDCSAAEVVHIGDSLPLDVEGARASGLRACHVARPGSDLLGILDGLDGSGRK